MRNLKILVNINHSLSLLNIEKFAVCTSDFNNNIFKRRCFIFIVKEGEVFRFNPVDGASEYIVSIKEFCESSCSIVSLFYNSILNSLNIVLGNGDVLSINLTGDLCFGSIQCVGSIVSGIQTVSLSPDTEIIVFVNGDNTLILMSGNFDPVGEIGLLDSDEGEQDMVNIGSEKKKTEYYDCGAMPAAKTTDEADIGNISANEKQPYISWRGDSSMFAVNFWWPEKNYRRIKIFNKYGVLQCISEFMSGLEGMLSWRPSGNLITLYQEIRTMYYEKNVICFMEKNGLRHGDFTLPRNIKVLDLSWNSESTILSSVCVDESVNQQCILLWTTGNYHWYLKQRLDMSCAVSALYWDEVIGNLAHILLVDGSYLALQWMWSVDHSSGLTQEDLAVVAVIDGYDVKLSGFQKCIIPPPMCGATVTLPSPALQVMFAPFYQQNVKNGDLDPSPNDLCVYLSDGQLAFIKGMETTPQLHKLVGVQWLCEAPTLTSPANLSHWLWLTRDQLVCVFGYQLCIIQLDDQLASVKLTIPLDEAVLTVSQETGSPHALIQLQSGTLLVFSDGSLTPLASLSEPCITLRSVNSHTFAQTHNNHLYVDGELVADNVTSFFCLQQFLIMTLSSHKLCVTNALSNFKVDSEGGRKVERGAVLVIATGHSVVLQMPRGNLETVQPRALTLVSAAQLLDKCDYKAVAQLLRRQRIDLNLCVDHNPTVFLLSASRFVGQVRDPQWLSVFLAELSEQDVTRTMYSSHYKHLAACSPPLVKKVERVCSALREAMTQTPEDQKHYMQPILTSLVREGRVGEAISLADTDQALSYLTLLMDADRLYESALAVYNLDKALKIAGKSQKDPKEYVAYLNELQGMEPAYMRYTIDKRLRKHQSALRNLAQCPECFTECLQYIQDTGLYSLALQLFKENADMYQKVCQLYGAQLEKKHSYQEAGLMYRRGGDISKALTMLAKAGCWQQYLTLAAEYYIDERALEKLQEALYSSLRAQQRYKEASELCNQLRWYERAVGNLVDAHDWVNAVYICHSHQLASLIESIVKPALLDCQSRSLADLKAKKEDMDKYSARLSVVRERKANLDANFDAMSDIQSDTSSLSSFSASSAGTRTTRNTRKAQRKLWSLKEGNPREEQALLFTITELVQTTERLTGDVHCLCLALAELGLDEEANNLHTAMTIGLQHVDIIRQQVWPASNVKKTGSDAEAIDPTCIDLQLTHPPTSCVVTSWKLDIYT